MPDACHTTRVLDKKLCQANLMYSTSKSSDRVLVSDIAFNLVLNTHFLWCHISGNILEKPVGTTLRWTPLKASEPDFMEASGP